MKPKYRSASRFSSLSTVIFAGVLAATSLNAATLYWDGNDTNGNANGGAGTWDNGTTANWDTLAVAGSNSVWTNSNDTAVFGGVASVAVNLGDPITVGGLTFNTTGYGIVNGANTLSFSAGDNTIRFNHIAAATITGTVAGSGSNVILTGAHPVNAGTLTLTGASAGGWSGTTTVNAGMTLASVSTASATNNALQSTTGITLNGGTIALTRHAGGNAQNQVSDSAGITFNGGGTLNLTNGIGAAFTETIGTVTMASGQANFAYSNGSSGGGVITTLSGLSRTGSTSAITFSNANSAQTSFVVTGAGGATPAGQIAGPWATTGTAIAAQTDYVVYNAGNTVLVANIAGSLESTWTTAANAFTQSASQTLGATRTITALRNTGATATTALGGFNLETNGLLNGVGTLWTISGAGAVTQQGTAAANLFATAGSGGITISSAINNNTGALTLVKGGSGTLTLSGTNGFTGGLVMNAGTVSVTTASLNNNAITVNGTATLVANVDATTTTSSGITLNTGSHLNIANANGKFLTVNGAVTGSGALTVSATHTNVSLLSSSNDFTGAIWIGPTANSNINSISLTVNSIGDSANAITFGYGNTSLTTNEQRFAYTGSSALILDNRYFEFGPISTTNANGSGTIDASGATAADTLTINTDLVVSGTGTGFTKNLTLRGANLGKNTFDGNIADGVGTPIRVIKAGAGRWDITGDMSQTGGLTASTISGSILNLSGTNTYSGTTINAFSNPATGFLVFQGMQALSNNTDLQQTHAGGVGGFGVIKLLDDSATPASRSGVDLLMLANNSSHTMNLFVGNNSVANGGTSGSTQTGSTITLGNLNFTQNVVGNLSQTLAVDGANDYRLQINNVNLPGLLASATTWNGIITATANTTIAGNIQQLAGNAAGTTTLTLQGTAMDSIVQGNILDSADVTPKVLTVTKSNAGKWTFFGNNTYSGQTSVTLGTLNIRHANALGSTALGTGVANAATLELQGGISYAAEALTLTTGTGTTSQLQNVSGDNTWNGTITTTGVSTFARISSDSGLLTLAGTVTGSNAATSIVLQGASAITITGQLTGSSGLISGTVGTGAGSIRTLSGATNNYTGATSITGGTLVGIGVNAFGSTPGISISGSTSVLSLRGDSSTSFVKASDATAYSVTTGASGATINADQATIAGIGAKTMTIGTLQINTAITNVTNFTGANNTSLSIGAVTTGTSVSGTETIQNDISGGGSLTLASIAVNRTTAPTLAFAGNGNTTVTGAITQVATTALTKTGNGTLTLTGTNLYSGTTTITTGTLQLGDGTSGKDGTIANSLSIVNNAALVYNRFGSTSYGGVISGTGTVTKLGVGTQALAGATANTYSGLTTVSAGILDLNKTAGVNAIAGDGNTATNDVLINGGTLRLQANEQIANNAAISQTSGGFNLNGKTETILSYNKTGGTFRTGIGGNLTATGSTITFDGGAPLDNIIDADSVVADHHLVLTNGATVDVYSTSDSGGGTAGGTLQLNAAGTPPTGLELKGTGGNIINLYSGTTSAEAGKLILKGNLTTSGTGLNTIAAIDGLASASKGTVNLDGATRTFTVADTVAGAGNDLLVSAIITNGGLTKAGAGTMTLSAANTYTGATLVSNGTLIVNGNISTSTLTTVESGATISGSGTVGALTVDSGGFINPGTGLGMINTGNLNQFGLHTAEIAGTTPVTQYDQISVTGAVDITGGSLATMFSSTGYAAGDLIFILLNDASDAITGTYATFAQGDTVTTYNGFDWQISYIANNTGVGTGTFTGGNDIALFAVAIPEPNTMLLGALGVLALLRRRR